MARCLFALALTALVAVALALATTGAAADEHPSARLVYARGEGAGACPDEAELRASVLSRLGYSPFQADAGRLVMATVTSTRSGLRGRIVVRSDAGAVTGSRTLDSESSDCVELMSAMTLAISIAIDPVGALRPPAPSSSTSAPEPAPALPPSPPPDASPVAPGLSLAPPAPAKEHPAPSRSAGPALRLGVGATASLGAEPAPSLGFFAEAGIRWSRVSVSIEGSSDLPASKDAPGGGSVQASRLMAAVVPCAHLGLAVVCAVGTIGALEGRAYGTASTSADKDTTLLALAGARAGVEVPLSKTFALRAAVDLLATLTRTTLRLGPVEAWTTPAFEGTAAVGGLARFP